jgi:hypothetical protein
MTITEIAQEMLKEADRYAIVKEEMVPKIVQTRTHKKKRINKKYKKLYGMKVVYVKKTARVIDVTYETIINFCREKNIPLPEELLSNTKGI